MSYEDHVKDQQLEMLAKLREVVSLYMWYSPMKPKDFIGMLTHSIVARTNASPKDVRKQLEWIESDWYIGEK